MKKTLIALTLAACAASPLAMAQQAAPAQPAPQANDHRPPMHRGGNPLRAALVQSWHLSDTKLQALKSADEQFHQTLKQNHDTKQTPVERRATFEKARQQYVASLRNVLDPQQLRAYMMADHPPMHGPMQPPMNPKMFQQRFTPLLESWNLDTHAREQVFAAQENFMKALHAQHPKTKEDFAKLVQQRNAALGKVLSNRQIVAFDSLTRPMQPPHRMHGPMKGPGQGPDGKPMAPAPDSDQQASTN